MSIGRVGLVDYIEGEGFARLRLGERQLDEEGIVFEVFKCLVSEKEVRLVTRIGGDFSEEIFVDFL